MKKIRIFLVLLALLLAGCGAQYNDYKVVTDGETRILKGEDYGRCNASGNLEKIQVICRKDGHQTLAIIADSFEAIAREE